MDFDLFSHLKSLEGQVLKTLADPKPFDFISIEDQEVIVRPHSTMKKRSIKYHKEIETSWHDLQLNKSITATQIKVHSDWSSSFVSSILATIPGVNYRLRPIRLFYSSIPSDKQEIPLTTNMSFTNFKTEDDIVDKQAVPTHYFRSNASFGKRHEFTVIAELLKRHYDVYLTLVDDKQIDCVVRIEKSEQLRYLDIQIKARSTECDPKNAGFFAAMTIPNPRENYFFIFYSEQAEMYWVIPSIDLVKFASRNILGKNAGKYSIKLANYLRDKIQPNVKYISYQNAFYLLI